MKSLGQRAPARGFLIPFHFYYERRRKEGKSRRKRRASFSFRSRG